MTTQPQFKHLRGSKRLSSLIRLNTNRHQARLEAVQEQNNATKPMHKKIYKKVKSALKNALKKTQEAFKGCGGR
jgi:hypothetical protein